MAALAGVLRGGAIFPAAQLNLRKREGGTAFRPRISRKIREKFATVGILIPFLRPHDAIII
jgi:hypothetical protein